MTVPAPLRPSDLPLPDPATLSADQLRGAVCVWCLAPLSNTAAQDLGPRTLDAHGTQVRWFPRGCPSCHRART